MKRMFRVLSVLLTVLLLTSSMPLTAHAEASAHGNPCTFCDSCDRLVTFTSPVHRIYGQTRYDTSFAIADTLKEMWNTSFF